MDKISEKYFQFDLQITISKILHVTRASTHQQKT